MKVTPHTRLDQIERVASELAPILRSTKKKLKIDYLLDELNDIWSEIYKPLMKSCEIFQQYSKKLDNLTGKSNLYFYFHCQKLLEFTIIDCLLILHSKKITKYLIENGIFQDFSLFISVLQFHSNLKKTAVGDRSFEELVPCYISLFSFQVIFFSTYHFIEAALIELNKKIITNEEKYKIFNISDEKHKENLLTKYSIPDTTEKKCDTLLFWKTKRGVLQNSTTIQMAQKYINEDCLVVLP